MFFYLFLLPLSLSAVSLNPWFDPIFDIKKKATIGYRTGKEVDALSVKGEVETTVWTDIKAGIDVDAAKTNKNGFSFEAIRFTGLYRFQNDILGDPISIVGGMTLSFPRSAFRRDVSVFEPSPSYLEAHLIVGKEEVDCLDWSRRKWAYITFGAGTKASSWLKTKLFYEINLYDWGYASFSLATLSGFGSNHLFPFKSYSHVAYRELGFGIDYFYDIYRIGIKETLYKRHYPSSFKVEFEVSL